MAEQTAEKDRVAVVDEIHAIPRAGIGPEAPGSQRAKANGEARCGTGR